jgi:hypothetical protein
MLYTVGFTLIFLLAVVVLFALAVFEAAVIEVRQKRRLMLVTSREDHAPETEGEERELPRAA